MKYENNQVKKMLNGQTAKLLIIYTCIYDKAKYSFLRIIDFMLR